MVIPLASLSLFILTPRTIIQANITSKVDYTKLVKPLLVRACYPCHGGGNRLGDFQLDTREAMLTGGKSHPVVRPGKASTSLLIRMVKGEIPGRVMPARGKRLTPNEIALLSRWIDQGAPFAQTDSRLTWKPVLAPRSPAVPPSGHSSLTNPIDRFIYPSLVKSPLQARVKTASSVVPVVDDAAFYRRVSLDLVGLLPAPAEVTAFRQSRDPGKRITLIQKLLKSNTEYAEHWLSFWNDLLRNDYTGTGYIDGGRQQITGWLYRALIENLPYDRFVRELVDPIPESRGFTKGIVWRGVVNASQVPEMQAAQSISQVFLGVNMKCASCHDSFINNWKLRDAYGLAGVYSEQPMQMVRCDKPTGTVAPVRFLYPSIASIDGAAPVSTRTRQLADALLSPQNGRVARTLVNRLWAKLMGRGLVEPNDDMDARPWNPDLLDWLANDLQRNGWDVKRTLGLIAGSRAYQMPTVGQGERAEAVFTFQGPQPRRLSAEQFVDAVSTLTGDWHNPALGLQIAKGEPTVPPHQGKVLWRSGKMSSGSAAFEVDLTGRETLFLVAGDAGNGIEYDWAAWGDLKLSGPAGEKSLVDLPWRYASAGFGQVRIGKSAGDKPVRLDNRELLHGIGAHANSVIAFELPKGYTKLTGIGGPDQGSVEQPGSKVSIELFIVGGSRSLLEARASMAVNDTLMTALGRPNREQIVSQRAPTATTLQALELTNGPNLKRMLESGARRWSASGWRNPADLVRKLFRSALSREPAAEELKASLGLLGPTIGESGIEDLLWSIVMLPEFQIVR